MQFSSKGFCGTFPTDSAATVTGSAVQDVAGPSRLVHEQSGRQATSDTGDVSDIDEAEEDADTELEGDAGDEPAAELLEDVEDP